MAKSYSQTKSNSSSLEDFLTDTFSTNSILALAKETGFVKRPKKFVPSIFVSACLAACDDKEWSLNSIYRRYITECIECGLDTMSWEPFFDFLQKPQFLDFTAALDKKCRDYGDQFTFSVVSKLVDALDTFGFNDFIVHDGSVVKISNKELGLTNQYTNFPALKLHLSKSLKSSIPDSYDLTNGSANERDYVDLTNIKGSIISMDAGYRDHQLYTDLADAGGYFLCKIPTSSGLPIEEMQVIKDGVVTQVIKPTITKGKKTGITRPMTIKEAKLEGICNDDDAIYDIISSLPNGLRVRLISYYATTREGLRKSVLLLTNIAPEILDAIQLSGLYRARWNVELEFRILKGFCALKGSKSGFLHIQKAMMIFAIINAMLKVMLDQHAEASSDDITELSALKIAHDGTYHMKKILQNIIRNKSIKTLLKIAIKALNKLCKFSITSQINREKGRSVHWIIDLIKRPTIKPQYNIPW